MLHEWDNNTAQINNSVNELFSDGINSPIIPKLIALQNKSPTARSPAHLRGLKF
jgi:hypothetical protein